MFKKMFFILTAMILSLSLSNVQAEWEAQKSGTTKNLRSVSFTDSSTGWAVGDGGVILHTSDGGATWTSQKSGATNNLLSVSFVNSTTGWASGAGGVLLSTTDGGTTWTPLTSGVPDDLKGICFVDAEKGWTVAAIFILKTPNSGENWIPAMLFGNPFTAIYFPDSINGWAVREGGLILKTGDGGGTWTDQTSGTENNLNAVYFANAGSGCAVGASGTILTTSNGGTAWSVKSSGITKDLNGVWFVSATKGWAVGAAGTILYTENGSTWTDESVGTKDLYGVCFADDATNGWAVGAAGTILHTGKDTILPTVTFSPANNAKNVEITATIKLTFSEPVRKTNGTEIQNDDLPTLFILKKTDASGEDVAFTGTIADSTVVTLTPSAELDYSQVYYVGIGAVVEDYAGNDIAIASAKFTTKTAPQIPVLSVTPASLDLTAAASTATLTVANTGTGTMNWTAAESLSWLSISPTSGTVNGTVTVTYDANSTGASRTGTITVTASGATGSPKSISVTQAAAGQEPVLSVTPASFELSATASTSTLTIANTGTGTLNWSAAESLDWLSLSPTSGTGSGTITLTYQANTGTSSRTGAITVTASGASGSPKSISVTQAAAGGTPVLSVTPASQDAPAGSGMVTYEIANTGSGTLSWTLSKDASWLTIIGTNSGTGNATMMISHQANTGAARTGKITVTASGATGSPKTVEVKQAPGTTEQAVLSIDPLSQEVPSASSTNAFTVKNTGTGAMAWTAVSNASWLTITLGASGTITTESSAIVVSFAANTGDVRTGTITVTATGAGGSPQTISVKQAAGAVIQPVLSVTPNFQTVVQSGGTAAFTVANTGTGTLSWTVSETSDWLSVDPLSGTNNATVTVTCQQNTGISRTGTLTFAATGATGSPKSVEVRQSGTSNQIPTDIVLILRTKISRPEPMSAFSAPLILTLLTITLTRS
ncbi:MAG: hypothetical protein BWK80_16070 [Desulfobacteraceae bacterium IS3]|nr:MAG: hypothetical protein BWK80_16070 [Desulfobacteraceae bacterium IS3]